MQINDNDILAQLERLGAAFPWDKVEITVRREPEGKIDFSAYIPQNDKFGWSSGYSFHLETPEQCVDVAIRETRDRDPEKSRDKKIAELQEQIRKLRDVVIGLPPYVPNRELAAHNGARNATVDIMTETEAVREGLIKPDPSQGFHNL